MPTLNSIHFPPPQDWPEFEDLCRDLWARLWDDPNTQRNGRSGQGQKGVDIFGYPKRGRAVEGVQCRVKNRWLGQYLTEQDVSKAVEEADEFEPALSRLTIATTSSRDATLQEKIRLFSDSRLGQSKFPVSVAFWEEIQSRLVEHEDLLRKYYSYFFSFERRVGQYAVDTNDLQVYLDRFRQHISRESPPLIPTRLILDDRPVQPMDLKGELAEHGVVHLYGPSGSGKSHLAKHLSMDLISERYASILVPAKYYQRDLKALLDKSVDHLTSVSAESIILGSAGAGFTVLLVLDGFNECPESLRADLVKDVKALQLRMAIQLIITSRTEVPCDSMLPGRVYKLDFLNHDERSRLIAYYGGPTGGIVDILRTPLDVRIAAESAARIEASSPTQYDLFHAYARHRLQAEPNLGFALLAKCAGKMADILAWTLSESEYHRLVQVTAGVSAGRTLEAVSDSGLMSFSHGHCSFWHERIQRFFQAEALLLQHTDVTELAAKLRSPRNEDVQGLILGALKDASAVQSCISAIQSEKLLLSMLCGDVGASVAAAVEASTRQVLNKAYQEISSLTIARNEDPQYPYGILSITSPVLWEEHEYLLVNFIGEAFSKGYFCDEILELIRRFDRICSEKAAEIIPKNPWAYLFPALYVGISPRTPLLGRIIQKIPLKIQWEWSAIAGKSMYVQLESLEHQSPGILLLLSAYVRDSLWHTAETSLLIQLPKFIQHLWDTRIYHLRLEAAELGQAAAHRIEEPLRTEVEELLESFVGQNIMLNGAVQDVMLNSAVIEALAQYKDLGVASEEGARSEVREVLDGPRDEEACVMAASLFGDQFKEVLGNHYYVAIEELEGKDRTDFHVMAALGMRSGDFFLDSILRRLIESRTPEACTAFERWISLPRPEGVNCSSLAGVFLLAHVGLARSEGSLPVTGPMSDQDEESWRVWGEILFWLHKPGVPEAYIREVCAPCWRSLQGPLLLASIDPIFEMEKYARGRISSPSPEIYKPVEFFFPHEVRILYENALPKNRDLTSLFGLSSHWEAGRAVFLIEGLGRLGDEGSILVLRPYAESDQVGRSAIEAVRSIRGRLERDVRQPTRRGTVG